MFLKKVLNQPNVVGTVMIALLFGAGFVYAFAFNGFNVETVPGTEVDAWLAAADGSSSGGSGGGGFTCDSEPCGGYGNPGDQYANCPARAGIEDCTGCKHRGTYCNSGGPTCRRKHDQCPCPAGGGCSKYNGGQTSCPKKGKKKCPERDKGRG